MEDKKTIAVIFGGRSSEHEVSCMSVINVASHIDTSKWNILLIGITKDGRWLLADSIDAIRDGSWRKSAVSAVISPDACKKCAVIMGANDDSRKEVRLDVVFPIMHGKYGEDGTIQGLLEMAGIPYVGCGVLSSAVCMDKFYTKIIVDSIGIRQAAFVGVHDYELKDMDAVVRRVEEKLDYPVFIKPSQAGSSCGVSKAHDRESLIKGLQTAAAFDAKILVEEFIRGREIESAVFGGNDGEVFVSGVGEILAAAEFYDYDAKYNNPASMTVIDPDLPEETVEAIRKDAAAIFRAVDGTGLSRVDFFVAEDGEVIFNEINTMPGFTAISMYPMLMEARGVDKDRLVENLIESAFKRREH